MSFTKKELGQHVSTLSFFIVSFLDLVSSWKISMLLVLVLHTKDDLAFIKLDLILVN